MEKTLQIDHRAVRFKCTAGTLIRYRNQFNREFLADLSKLQNVKSGSLESFTLAPIENILWVMAKTADESIPDPMSWYDTFDNFPLVEVFTQLQDILVDTIKTKNSSGSAAVHPARARRSKRR